MKLVAPKLLFDRQIYKYTRFIHSTMDFHKPETVLNLANIRDALRRMEDTIVFNMIERAQFYQSDLIYKSKANGDSEYIEVPDFDRSFLDWALLESEKMHAKIRRYEAPDELAFNPTELPEPILPKLNYPKILASYSKEINVNDEIKQVYIKEIVPRIAAGPGEQSENYGSCAITDIDVLQSLSRRIHFGKFVAEAKFRNEKEKYTQLIKARDIKGIEEAITNAAVEEKILVRLMEKAAAYGTDPSLKWSQKSQGKIDTKVVSEIYKRWVIPLTKKVEVDYLLRRLEDEEEEQKEEVRKE